MPCRIFIYIPSLSQNSSASGLATSSSSSIPSYRVKTGEIVGWNQKTKTAEFAELALRGVGQRPVPDWLQLDKTEMTGLVARLPEHGDIDSLIDLHIHIHIPAFDTLLSFIP